MRYSVFLLIALSFLNVDASAQKTNKDSLFLMNGKLYVAAVIDTSIGTVTFHDEKDTSKKIHIDYTDLYGIKYAKTGAMFYYYKQDSALGNIFTRDEMLLFMKGERDAKNGFKARGSFWGAMVMGSVGGLTGSILGPIVPFAYVGLSGLPKVRIKHDTVSNPYYLDSDPYILGYERQARSIRRIQGIKGGLIGLVAGYTIRFFLDQTHNPVIPKF